MATHNVMDLFRVDGQTAPITGGARNLGRDMAEALSLFRTSCERWACKCQRLFVGARLLLIFAVTFMTCIHSSCTAPKA